MFGGVTMERTLERLCDVDDPNLLRFCDQTGKLYQECGKVEDIYKPEFKLAGTHPLPWGSTPRLVPQLRGVGARSPGRSPASVFPNGQRTQAVTIGTSQPGALTAPGGLVPPGTKFGDRWNQLDLGIKKNVRLKVADGVPAMVFNSLNASPVLTYNNAFALTGSTLDRPLSNLQPRLLRLSIRASF